MGKLVNARHGSHRRGASKAIALLTLVVHAGCGVGLPLAPSSPDQAPGFERKKGATPPGMEDSPAQQMHLMPGDEVRVRIMSAETQEYKGLTIDEQGLLHLPLIGDVDVGGQTLTEAEQRVQKAYREYDRVAQVAIIVSELSGHVATVLGAVEDPGHIMIKPGTRLADLLALADGPMKEVAGAEVSLLADLEAARLVRDGEALPVSLQKALEGHPRHNVRIKPGDHLYVPPSRGRRITVLGKVGQPTVIPHRRDLRLTEALAQAGGIRGEGDQGDVRIIRGAVDEPKVYYSSVADLVDGDSHDVQLAPGDIVFVTQRPIASIGEVLNYLAPILAAGTTIGVTTAVVKTNNN